MRIKLALRAILACKNSPHNNNMMAKKRNIEPSRFSSDQVFEISWFELSRFYCIYNGSQVIALDQLSDHGQCKNYQVILGRGASGRGRILLRRQNIVCISQTQPRLGVTTGAIPERSEHSLYLPDIAATRGHHGRHTRAIRT